MLSWTKKLGNLMPHKLSEARRAELTAEIHTAACFSRLLKHDDWPAMTKLLEEIHDRSVEALRTTVADKPLTEEARIYHSTVAGTIKAIMRTIEAAIVKGKLAQAELDRLTPKKEATSA